MKSFVAILLALTIAATGCAEVTSVAAVIEAQRTKIRIIKIGVKVYKVTKLTDKEYHKLKAKIEAAHSKPEIDEIPHLHQTADAVHFGWLINGYRKVNGLGHLDFDESLSVQAEDNNKLGGHHRYLGDAGGQCWASVTDMTQAFEMWKHSPGHNRLMLGRSFTKFGIASGPGNHCTLNLK